MLTRDKNKQVLQTEALFHIHLLHDMVQDPSCCQIMYYKWHPVAQTQAQFTH